MIDLIGKVTQNGWLIKEEYQFTTNNGGGFFSKSFLVTKQNDKAFLKVLNIDKFTDINDLISVFSEFKYEIETANFCLLKKMSNVVKVIDSGEIDRGDFHDSLKRKIPYIIFEKADGDISEKITTSNEIPTSWKFFLLHQVTLGLMQLHKSQIAHQDVKPSNLLYFPDKKINLGVQETIKLGDLGRATQRNRDAPHDSIKIPGAIIYAPFEQRYSYVAHPEWALRRITNDVFQLGAVIAWVFTGIVLPSLVISSIDEKYQPNNWTGSYNDVMLFLKNQLILEVKNISNVFPTEFKDEITSMILDLCEPDPLMRGKLFSKNGKPVTNELWLERYASRLSILNKRATVYVKKGI